ncbi:S8 family serine peptidase [Geobacter sp.]|uniref:S8 family peptidase n=1 Tax=Geobacter sp. TaxID=46610 RepID=UPI00262D42A8|nr:S8 family serine peptidase [Geobacter sp.]
MSRVPGALHEFLPVIVRLRDGVDNSQLAASMGEERRARHRRVVSALRKKAYSAQGGVKTVLAEREKSGKARLRRSFWVFNGLALDATPETLRNLAERDDVAEIFPDRVIKMAAPVALSPAVAPSGNWGIDRVAVAELWDAGYRGKGAVVAFLDSGVDIATDQFNIVHNPDLRSKWRGGTNSWFDPYTNSTFPYESGNDGHGTSVAGVAVGGNHYGIPVGVAPEATWIAAKIFDDAGSARISAIYSSFQWILDLPAAEAPDVVNCSWDLVGGTFDDTFRIVISNLRSAGVPVVFAAGNSGPSFNTSLSPANYPEVTSVGATGSDDSVSDFSSRGPSAFNGSSIFPSVVAPGDNVLTTSSAPSGVDTGYVYASGTSFSAPFVAGTIALLRAAARDMNLSVSAEQVEQAIARSALDLGEAGPDNSYGNGFVDAARAARVLGILPPLPAPNGDVDGDGSVTIKDVLFDLRAAVGVRRTVADMRGVMASGDVFPLSGGVPAPDLRITLNDVLALLRKALRFPTAW